MRQLAYWASEQGWPLLFAHAVRIRLVVFGEHIDNLDEVVRTGTVLADDTADAQARGLIEATIARQLSLKKRWADARTWYTRALSRPPSSIEQLEYDALVGAANA